LIWFYFSLVGEAIDIRLFPLSDCVHYDDVHKLVINQDATLESHSHWSSCFSLGWIIDTIKEEGVGQVQELKVFLNHPWVIYKTFLKCLFECEADETVFS